MHPANQAICNGYSIAQSFIEPFVGPYYDAYASPYVEKAKPYVETANTRVIKPATVLAIDKYNIYAAPQVSKAKDYALSQWESKGLPHLKKAQDVAQQAYDENLAPHVQKASDAASPYYETARDNALNVHEKHIIPAIAYSQPHLQSLYAATRKFTMEKGIPSVQHAWTNVIIFVDGTMWPFVKKVYADNVRPQLVMIGERIAKYQEGRKLQSAMLEVDVSASTSTVAETVTQETSSILSSSTTTTSIVESSSTQNVASTQSPKVATDETVKEDLVKWQKKFAIAADKGTDDLKERIEDIVNGLAKSGLSEGQGLANALEKTTEVELSSIKSKIKAVASNIADDADSSTFAAAEAEIVQAVRQAGAQIKDRAKNVRSWADTFKQDLAQRTELATDSTLHVLDDIRDLGLQEIGMRWAWMEGITYKHWQKYHDLKRKFADWRSEVREVALSHHVIGNAREQAEELLEESMAITETAAKELIRLRGVAKWKVASRDATDDFEDRAIPVVAAAVSAASSVADDIREALAGSRQGTAESISSVASSTISSYAAGATDTIDSLAYDIEDAASGMSNSASLVISGTSGSAESVLSQASSMADSVASSASSKASSAVDAFADASSAAFGNESGSIQAIGSALSASASSQASVATEAASSFASSETVGPSEGLLSSASSSADSISSSASSAIVSASASEKLQSAIDDAGDKIADFTSSLNVQG